MNLPINTTADGTAFAVTTRSSAVAFENVSQGGGALPFNRGNRNL